MNRRTDGARFAQALTAVAELYGKTLSEPAMRLWWQLLEGYDIEAVEHALYQCLRSADQGQFMPKPADVVRAIEGSTVDRALAAWGKVLDAMRRVGAYRSVAFDDPAIHAAISDMGGWIALCRSEVRELAFLQKRFTDLYRVGDKGSAPGHLPGEFELSNRLLGYDVDPPVLVGDPERARACVLSGGAQRARITAALATVGADHKEGAR